MTKEEKLAEDQAKLGQEIAAQELDDEALDMVSGGGSGNSCYATEDCDNKFQGGCLYDIFHPNGTEMNDGCSTNFGCTLFNYCDETLQFQ